MIRYVHCSSCEVPLLLSDFNESWIFKTNFSAGYSLSIILKKSTTLLHWISSLKGGNGVYSFFYMRLETIRMANRGANFFAYAKHENE